MSYDPNSIEAKKGALGEKFYFADDKKKEAANDPFPSGEDVDPADYPF